MGFERDGLGPVTDFETCLIGPRRRHRAPASGRRGVLVPWSRVPKIPRESVHAGTLFELGCSHAFEPPLAHARFLRQDVGLTASVAREAAHELAFSIENLELDLSRRLAREVVVDISASFGILRLVGRHPRAIPATRHPKPIRIFDREKVRVSGGDALVDLVQRRQIVEDPKASSHRGHHEIFVDDFQIRDRRDRQVQLKRLPVLAVVEGDEHPELGAGIKKSGRGRDPRAPHGRDESLGMPFVPVVMRVQLSP